MEIAAFLCQNKNATCAAACVGKISDRGVAVLFGKGGSVLAGDSTSRGQSRSAHTGVRMNRRVATIDQLKARLLFASCFFAGH